MTTRTMTCNRGVPLGLFILFATIAAGLAICTHALRHSMSERVLNCPDSNIAMRLRNPFTGNIATICEFEPGQFGRMICPEGEAKCISAYASERRAALNDLTHVVRNMHNTGYREVQFINRQFADQIAEILAKILVP